MDFIIAVFFPAFSFKTILEALKMIVLPVPSYTPHQGKFKMHENSVFRAEEGV